LTEKTIRGVDDPRWWQVHPTLAFCGAWALLLIAGAAVVLLN